MDISDRLGWVGSGERERGGREGGREEEKGREGWSLVNISNMKSVCK